MNRSPPKSPNPKSPQKRRSPTRSAKPFSLAPTMAKQPPPRSAVEKALMSYVESIWEQYDYDRNGVLDREEAQDFVKEMMFQFGPNGGLPTKTLKDDQGHCVVYEEDGFEFIFQMLDTDNSGTIDKTEMMQYMRHVCKFSDE